MARTRVDLPRSVPADFEVYVNGVPQRRGTDYRVEGRSLLFDRELRKEGRLGLWRWFLGAWGIGTYRQNDSIDVRYEVRGMPQVLEGLEPQPLGEASGERARGGAGARDGEV